jgi:tetratricopeptide (TPR) repeat protein
MATFGHPGRDHDAEDRAEMLFLHNFRTAEENAESALLNKDYSGAEQALAKARGILTSTSDGKKQIPAQTSAQWQWMTTMGRLRMAEKKYDDSEQYYKEALGLYDTGKNVPEGASIFDAARVAASLRSLGILYAEEQKYDLAYDHASRSVAIYKKNFKKVGPSNPGAQQAYVEAIASQSWMLSKLAVQQKNNAEAVKDCQAVLEFQNFLSAAQHDSFVPECQQVIMQAVPKP